MDKTTKELVIEILEKACKLDEKRQCYLLGYLNGLVASKDD